jgi:hypothetical protein
MPYAPMKSKTFPEAIDLAQPENAIAIVRYANGA